MTQSTIRECQLSEIYHDVLFDAGLLVHRYAATRGLLWSHMGWIFRKPVYERMKLVDSEDLNSDPSK